MRMAALLADPEEHPHKSLVKLPLSVHRESC
jgi:hypothetical protein